MDLVEQGYDDDEGDSQEEEEEEEDEEEDKETVQELKGRVIGMEVRKGEKRSNKLRRFDMQDITSSAGKSVRIVANATPRLILMS